MSLSGVSRSSLITLRARVDEHARKNGWFRDPVAVEWFNQLQWSKELDAWYRTRFTQLANALRARQFDEILFLLLQEPHRRVVVELGCGLSTRRQRMEPDVTWHDLDLPEVIATREQLGADVSGAIAASVLESDWMNQLDAKGDEVVFLAEGLLYYLPRQDVDALILRLRQRFPGSVLVFDVQGAMDFARVGATTAKFDAPMMWGVDPPFDNAIQGWGLQVVAGLEQARLVERSISCIGERYGALGKFVVRSALTTKAFRDRRSGIIVGALQPV